MPPVPDITNFHQITPLIGTSGMPSPEQIHDIADAGYEMVINLALPSYPGAMPDEGALVSMRGLTYVHIPVEFDRPTLADFESFAAILRANKERKVFVHCAMNYRVSAFMYLYRLIEGEATQAQATADLRKLWEPEPTWQDLIEEVLDAHDIAIED